MFKQSLLVLVASGAISFAAPFVAAQDAPAPDQQSQSAPEHGNWHRGPQDPAARTKELAKRLNLTADQQTKVQEALQSQHSQMESLRQDTSLSQEDRRAKMMDIHKSTDEQIRGVLDATQQKKWDEMQAKREQRMQGHHPPDAGSNQAPPQQ
ncbi:MAG TPA: hypothetical protein VH350_06245 [Candidatus Sulfotelmatobacter sp.]|nr:hypothetical protein [Candidatus Sulfotelmatobacter sp.]